MSKDSENEEKVFENYLNLPFELRMMIVDEMEQTDRCRFSGCSMLSHKEAKYSKNYIHGLELYCRGSDSIQIKIIHDEWDTLEKRPLGYALKFLDISGKKYMKCERLDEKNLWVMILEESTNLRRYATEHFKKLLKLHQRTIRGLGLHCQYSQDYFKDVDFEIVSLRNLKRLVVLNGIDIQQFISKVHHPLINIWSEGLENNRTLANSKHIYKVEHCLIADSAQLNNEQFLQLAASIAILHLGELTERDIFNFVRSWQCGSIRQKVERRHWYMTGSNFNGTRFFEYFGVEYDDDAQNKVIMIDQYCEKRKRAQLSYYKPNGRNNYKARLEFIVLLSM